MKAVRIIVLGTASFLPLGCADGALDPVGTVNGDGGWYEGAVVVH